VTPVWGLNWTKPDLAVRIEEKEDIFFNYTFVFGQGKESA
jgi:hypothetical protein